VKRNFPAAIPCMLLALALILSGCASKEPLPTTTVRAQDIAAQYPQTLDKLRMHQLTATTIVSAPETAGSPDIFVIVHPAYSIFFRDRSKDAYSDMKYRLLKRQFDNEARLIRSQAAAGKAVVLVLPGNYAADSSSPLSYVTYLNSMVVGTRPIYYVLSETSSSGTLPIDDMVNLYQFLQSLKVNKVMIGGGYIGRCQREFYNQLTTYLDRSKAYIVPEISTISPDDVSDAEARTIIRSLSREDFTPVKAFIDKKSNGKANVLSLPQKRVQ